MKTVASFLFAVVAAVIAAFAAPTPTQYVRSGVADNVLQAPIVGSTTAPIYSAPVASIAALRALNVTAPALVNGAQIQVSGYYAANDGGGGTYVWNSASTAADNGGTVIQATGVATGRWILQYSGAINVRWFGAYGDGTHDDTLAIQSALTYIQSIPGSGVYFPHGSYVTSGVTLVGATNVVIRGDNAVLLKLPSTGTMFWGNTSCLLSLCGCTQTSIENLVFDGNRPNLNNGNVGFNFGVMVMPAALTVGANILNNNYGASKPTNSIRIVNCSFQNTGSYYAGGGGTYGDGIYMFAADTVLVDKCVFNTMGRWAVAASDVFRLKISNCVVNNPASSTAIGSFDFEQESTDQTNGSYSSDIKVTGCSLTGKIAIALNAQPNASNSLGTYHYLNDVTISECSATMLGYSTYGQNIVGINDVSAIGVSPSMQSINIVDNTLIADSVSTVPYGISWYSNGASVVFRDVLIRGNKIYSCTTAGIYANPGVGSNITAVIVDDNVIAGLTGFPSGYGVNVLANNFDRCLFTKNIISDYGNGIRLVQNSAGSYVTLSGNRVSQGAAASFGTAYDITTSSYTWENNISVHSGGTDVSISGTLGVGARGEYIKANVPFGSNVPLTTGTPANVVSISLTAGDWDVSGFVGFVMVGGTSTWQFGGVATASATFQTDNFVGFPISTTTLSDNLYYPINTVRLSLSSTTTVYLVAQCTFSAGTVGAFGTIQARRAR